MEPFSLNSIELLDYQPNRYPFLMIDFVTSVKPGEFANGYKNVTMNEWYFPKHFPGHPNVPGALQLESLAQMLTVAITTLPGNKGKVTFAISHTIKFKKEVVPGDKFEIQNLTDFGQQSRLYSLATSSRGNNDSNNSQEVVV